VRGVVLDQDSGVLCRRLWLSAFLRRSICAIAMQIASPTAPRVASSSLENFLRIRS
jgi:hypothetical protein